ncbi:MAG: outer membrane protein assembly factor BamB [Pseudomonadota bacterium]
MRTTLPSARLLAPLLLAPLLLAGCSTFSSITSWFSMSKPVRVPKELTEIKSAVPVRTVWKVSLGRSNDALLEPAVTANAVYAAAGNGTVLRLAPETGAEVWRFSVDAPLATGVGSDGFTVAVATTRGELVAIDAEGKQRWRAPLGSEAQTTPLVGRGLVVVRTADNRVVAFDAASGKRRWSAQRQAPALSVRLPMGLAYGGDLVLSGMPNGRLLALAPANGAPRWEATISDPRGATEVERLADVVGTPWVDGGDVCAGSYQGKVACLDVTSGALRWSRDFDAGAAPSADARNVYAVNGKSHVAALSRTTGSQQWISDKLEWRDVSAPLPLGRALVVGDFKGYVHFLSVEDGSFLARTELSGAIVVAPKALAGGALVQTSRGELALLSIE